ncbi:MAG TPA: ABC transporter permease [Pyrinomonadaceae bacterium]|jgi:putative ABC transport system permease protein
METIWQDIRYGGRVLLKKPVFTTVIILALALAIGANTAIFSVINAILLRPLAYDRPERLVMLWEANMKKGWGLAPTSYLNFTDMKEQNKLLEGLAAFTDSSFNLTGRDEPERVKGLISSANLFSLLGVKPARGRAFLPDEDVNPKAGRVLVLSWGLWQRRFGGDPNVIGQNVLLNDESYTVVGVMPEDFHFPPLFTATVGSARITIAEADLWLLLTPDDVPKGRELRTLFLLGRLKEGTTLEQARAEMSAIARRLETDYPIPNTGLEIKVIPLQQQVAGDIGLPLFILFGAVSFILLIACANITNLLLARATERQKEIGIRQALGATRLRLVRQLLTESVLMSLLGGAAGLLLAYWGIKLITGFGPTLPRTKEIGIDLTVLLFTLLVSVLTAVIFGLSPALQLSKADFNEVLKEGGRNPGGGRRRRLHRFLVISEVALSLVLLIAAGLMIKSLLRLQKVNPGFNPDNLLTMNLFLPKSKYGEEYRQAAFQQRLLERVAALPGVEGAATVDDLPFGEMQQIYGFNIEGQATSEPSARPRAYFRTVSPDYFRVMGIPLVKGRTFSEQDKQDAEKVVMINDAVARRYWPGEDPLNKHIKRGRSESNSPWLTVVGVVGSANQTALTIAPQPEIYLPYLQNTGPAMTLVTRTASNPKGSLPSVQREVSALEKDLPVSDVKLMTDLLSTSIGQPRLYTLLLGIFAFLAIVLTALGIYGVMSYSVTQRTHEIGVRMALGAQPSDILKMVIRESVFLTLCGLAIGLALTFALTRTLSSLLFGVTPFDLTIFALLSLVMFGIALLSSYLPARRSTKVNPLIALRYE